MMVLQTQLPRLGKCTCPSAPQVVLALPSACQWGVQFWKASCFAHSQALLLRCRGSSRATVVPVAAQIATPGRIAPSQERQQHVVLDKAAERRRRAVDVAKLLTNHIVAASTLEQLHDVLAMHGRTLNHIHVAALLSRTAHICTSLEQPQAKSAANGSQQQQEADQQQAIQQHQLQDRQQLLTSRLTEMMVQRVRHANAPTLVASVAALGRLSSIHGITPPAPQQLQQFAAKTLEVLPNLSLSQLTVIIWGLAKAGYSPPSSWLDAVLTAFLQQYQAAATEQQQLQQHTQQATQQHEGTRLQRPVLPTAANPLHHHEQGLSTLPDHAQRPNQHTIATDLSLMIYSLAVMGKQLNVAWITHWQTAVLQQLTSASMQDLCQYLWGLAQLGTSSVNDRWLDQVLEAAEQLLIGASAWSLSSIIGALARLSYQPKKKWMDAYLAALQQHESLSANPQAFSCCLASLAKLKVSVAPSVLSTLLEGSTEHLPTFSPWQLTNTCWACASMNFAPSSKWSKKFLEMTARLADAGQFTVNQLSSVIWSLAVIQRSSDALLASQQLQIMVLLQAICAANGGQGLRQLGPSRRSGLAWALATLGAAPSRPWLAQFLAACFDGGLAADHIRCANVLFCIAAVDYEYLVEWLKAFLSGAAALNGGGELDVSLEKYAALVGVLQALSEMDSKQLRAAWLDSSNSQWSTDVAAGNEGLMGSASQLSPALAGWVDSIVAGPVRAPASKRRSHQPQDQRLRG